MKSFLTALLLLALGTTATAQHGMQYLMQVHQLSSKASVIATFGEPMHTVVRDDYERCTFADEDYKLVVVLKNDAVVDYRYTQRASGNALSGDMDITRYTSMQGQHSDVLVEELGYPTEIKATPTSEIWMHHGQEEMLIVRINPENRTITEVVWVPKG